jgi:hypothetical protein
MQNRERILMIIICAILLGVIFLLTLERESWKHKAIIANENYEAQLLNSKGLANGYTRTLQLTQDQFKEREGSYLDSINKLSDEKIKLAHVLRLTKFELSKKQQVRVEWRDSLIAGDTVRVGRCVSVMDSCLSINVFEPEGSDTAYVDLQLDIQASVIVYEGKRSKQAKLFGLNLFRYGKRITSAKMNTNCENASIIIDDVEIINK